eukprot:maker-scaffold1069_size64751-snap-gene-0.13 protein:Tk02460 transcript:maker-scaffold1069_size64751-snap-gene-0.13-mRNA-1 annotation:"nucleolar protein 14 homolog"
MAKSSATGSTAQSVARQKLTLTRNNPFERRFGRDKHRVLNRRGGSGVREGGGSRTAGGARVLGQPGVQKGRALLQRQATLLPEFRNKDKDNVWLDRRIGRDPADEAGQVARFALEKRFQAKRASVFQLGDDEAQASDMLTHLGKNLAEIERFDQFGSDDEDYDTKDKALQAALVSETHFGGFMTKADVDFAEGRANTRQQWIETMISESKKNKAERQKTLAENQNLTQDLDQQWKSMWGQVKVGGAIHTQATKAAEAEARAPDPYDQLVRELTFETQSQVATERTKTDEEIIKEERDKLEKLEAERRRRMDGTLDARPEPEPTSDSEAEGESDSDHDGSPASEAEGHSDLEASDEETDLPARVQGSRTPLAAGTRAQSMASARRQIPFTFSVPPSFEVLVDHFSQRTPAEHATIIQRIMKCNHPQFGDNNKLELQTLFAFLLQYINDSAIDFDPDINEADESETLLQTIDAIAPFLYDLAQFSPQPSAKALSGVLREKYEEYLKHPKNTLAFESLIFLKITCLLFPTSDYRHPVITPALQWMSQYLAQGKFGARSSIASGLYVATLFAELIFLKITCLLFPTSDYRHPVITPALQWMSQYLAQGKFGARSSIASGLYVATLFAESIRLSKRFSPELLNFLVGLVYLCFPKDKTRVTPFVPPFKCVGIEAEVLASKLDSKCAPKPLSMRDTKTSDELDDSFVSSVLSASLRLLGDLVDLWFDLPAASEIFGPLEHFLGKLCQSRLHAAICNQRNEILQKLERLTEKRRAVIQSEKKKPKILRQLEPEIDDNFDPFMKKRVGSREKLELNKLIHKTKREKKGAKKDIRADAAFLATQKAKDRRERDLERMKRTKDILSGLGNQEGEVRQLEKKKKRMK